MLIWRWSGVPAHPHFQPLNAGINRLTPVPQAEQFRVFNNHDRVLKSEAQLHRLLAGLPEEGERSLLVTAEMCWCGNRDLDCGVLETFGEKYYDVEAARLFFRSKVRLLRRKASAGLDLCLSTRSG